MKIFTSQGMHLANLAVPAKLVYTLFLLFIALGVASSYLIYAGRVGVRLHGSAPSVAAHYLGQADTAPALKPPAVGGPSLDLLPDDPAAASLSTVAPPADQTDLQWSWILDVFHQHLFSVSVVFLILAHLFMLTRLRAALSGTVIGVAGLSALAHVLSPVIMHLSGGGLWLMPVTGSLMGLSWAFMIGWTLGSMWLGWGRVVVA